MIGRAAAHRNAAPAPRIRGVVAQEAACHKEFARGAGRARPFQVTGGAMASFQGDRMGVSRRPLVAGNWKMNGLKSSTAELGKIAQGCGELWRKADLMVCPPATLVMTFAVVALGSRVAIGAQDCHAEPSGAFTGDISAEMLADLGASAVIVGHSERRTHHRETDA